MSVLSQITAGALTVPAILLGPVSGATVETESRHVERLPIEDVGTQVGSATTVATGLASPRTLAGGAIGERTDSRWHRYVNDRLNALRDGKGSFEGLRQPQPGLIRRAREAAAVLLDVNSPPPSVVPTADGDVRFSWRKSGVQLDIEFCAGGDFYWLRDRVSGVSFEGYLAEELENVRKLLKLLAL